MYGNKKLILTVVLIAQALFAATSSAQIIDPFYAGKYTLTNLGKLSGVPADYGAVVFKIDDAQTLLIAGHAEDDTGAIYQVTVVRNDQNIITGFSGTATKFADAPGTLPDTGISAGLVYGPNNVLFYSSYDDNRCAQLKPGSTSPDTFTDLTLLGVLPSVSGLAIVPAGFGGAGRIKFVSYDTGEWYDGSITANAAGTFDISDVSKEATFPDNHPEGFVYVKAGQPLFTADSIILAEYHTDLIVTYQVNANGDPIENTRRVLADMNDTGPEGLAFDPISGDLIVANFSSDDIYKIHGFFPPRCPVDANTNGVGDACETGVCGVCGAGVTMFAPIAMLAMWVGRRRRTSTLHPRR
jgi:hypothetical protein